MPRRVQHPPHGRTAVCSKLAFTCDTIGVNPGERWDAIIDCRNPGVWAFHCQILPHAESRSGMFGMVNALIVQP